MKPFPILLLALCLVLPTSAVAQESSKPSPQEIENFKKATRRSEAAQALMQAGRLEDAIQAFQKLLKDQEAELGKDHQLVARTWNNLAFCLSQADRHEEAVDAGREALRIAKLGGDPSPGTAQVRRNLAGVAERMGDLEQAAVWIQKAVEDFEASYGRTPMAAEAREAAARIFLSLGRTAEAQQHLEWATAIYERVLGGMNPTTSRPMSSLADLLARQGKVGAALLLFEHAANALAGAGAEGSAGWQSLLDAQLAQFRRLGENIEAKEILDQILSRRTAMSLEGAESWSRDIQLCGRLLDFGFAEDAEPVLQALVERLRQSAPQSLEMAQALGVLGYDHFLLGHWSSAVEHLQEGVQLAVSEIGEANDLVSEMRFRLGQSLAADGNLDQAKEVLMSVLEIRREALGEDHPALLPLFLALLEVEVDSAGITVGALDLLDMAEACLQKAPPSGLSGLMFQSWWTELEDYDQFLRHARWTAAAEKGKLLADSFQVADRQRQRSIQGALAWWLESGEAFQFPSLGRFFSHLRQAERLAVPKEQRKAFNAQTERLRKAALQSDSAMGSLVLAQGADLQQARAFLQAEDQAILIFPWSEESVWAMLVTSNEKTDQLVSLGEGRAWRSELAEFLAACSDAELNPDLDKWSRRLLQPLGEELAAFRKVYIVPEGPLAFVPFEALTVAKQPWARHCRIAYAASVQALLQAQKAEGGQEIAHFGPGHAFAEEAPLHQWNRLKNRFAVEPGFSPRPAIAPNYPDGEAVYQGAEVTESSFREFLAALPNRLRFLDLQLPVYLDAQVPSATCLVFGPEAEDGRAFWQRPDGLLDLGEVFHLNVNADFLLLPAAAVGPQLGELDLHPEGLFALVCGLQTSGAAGVCLSQWNAPDGKGWAFEAMLRQEVRNGEVSEALWRAQRRWLRKAGEEVSSSALHPAHWARFRFFGI
ncbi:MAG: CHAT domain-containing protein [Planctomycetota bacterium]|nr:MAG: CHAT domain-containing protein [Planctomycetota bacterium]